MTKKFAVRVVSIGVVIAVSAFGQGEHWVATWATSAQIYRAAPVVRPPAPPGAGQCGDTGSSCGARSPAGCSANRRQRRLRPLRALVRRSLSKIRLSVWLSIPASADGGFVWN